ncbi:DNA-binding protein HEXBP [Trichoplax sp. H2]|nr:DNA-binding protein HEXBP [Trichoplax sp. H2]|eukprot:RDD43803.1 DNA-binding protein HEXBP [Trichoplax sp. H2]
MIGAQYYNLRDCRCFLCGNVGHVSAYCPFEDDLFNKIASAPACYKCGLTNHSSINCPNYTEDRRCYKCHKVGHLASHCTEPRRNTYLQDGQYYSCNGASHLGEKCKDQKGDTYLQNCKNRNVTITSKSLMEKLSPQHEKNEEVTPQTGNNLETIYKKIDDNAQTNKSEELLREENLHKRPRLEREVYDKLQTDRMYNNNLYTHADESTCFKPILIAEDTLLSHKPVTEQVLDKPMTHGKAINNRNNGLNYENLQGTKAGINKLTRITESSISKKVDEDVQCYRCKGRGHYARDCRNIVCYRCGSRGHYAYTCKSLVFKK